MARSGPLLSEAQWNEITPFLPKPPRLVVRYDRSLAIYGAFFHIAPAS